jgi:preprotein translocase subunit SecB
MEAILQFKDYHVLHTEYLYNPFAEEKEARIRPQFDFEIDFPEENNKKLAFIRLGVKLGDEQLIEHPFFVSATILGVFAIKTSKEIDEELILDFYKVNAVAILFPYLRSLVSDLTSKGSETPIILPTMNVVEMIRKYHENKEKEA